MGKKAEGLHPHPVVAAGMTQADEMVRRCVQVQLGRRGLWAKELAELLGIREVTARQKLLSGRLSFSVAELCGLAAYLDIGVVELVHHQYWRVDERAT